MSDGSKRETQALNILKRAGYAPYKPATVRFGENDVWGLFDIIAISPHRPLRGIQVKSNRPVGLADWRRHTRLWRAAGWLTEYWVPKDGEGWMVYDAGRDPDDGRLAAKRVYDEREDPDVGPYRDTPLNLGDGVVEFLRGESNVK